MTKWKVVFARLNDDFTVTFRDEIIPALTKQEAFKIAVNMQCYPWGIWGDKDNIVAV